MFLGIVSILVSVNIY